MARSRVINIQRVSLSTPFIRTRKWETTRTQHRSVERKKKKRKKGKNMFRRRQVCARSAESAAKRNSTASRRREIRRWNSCFENEHGSFSRLAKYPWKQWRIRDYRSGISRTIFENRKTRSLSKETFVSSAREKSAPLADDNRFKPMAKRRLKEKVE